MKSYGYIAGVLLLAGLVQGQQQYQGRRQLLRQAPQPVVHVEEKEIERPKVYETHREISPNVGDGSFRYYSATSDGLESEQAGHFSNPLDSQVHQGSYTTTDEHGQVVRVNYVADKDGFRPIGADGRASLPTPPPIPAELAQATHDILAQQRAIREQHLGYLRAGYAAHGQQLNAY